MYQPDNIHVEHALRMQVRACFWCFPAPLLTRFCSGVILRSIMYKTRLPLLVVFNKTDVQPCDFAAEWMTDSDALQAAVDTDDTYMGSLVHSMSLVLDEFYKQLRVRPGRHPLALKLVQVLLRPRNCCFLILRSFLFVRLGTPCCFLLVCRCVCSERRRHCGAVYGRGRRARRVLQVRLARFGCCHRWRPG
jgi:hypothetical protein